jgi:hypothetical protein
VVDADLTRSARECFNAMPAVTQPLRTEGQVVAHRQQPEAGAARTTAVAGEEEAE